MQFLLDADLSARLTSLFAERGHHAQHVNELAHGRSPDLVIAEIARTGGRCIVTADFDFANTLNYPPQRYAGIVVFTLPRNAGFAYIEHLTVYFLDQLPTLGSLRGKLVIVEAGRIRVRD